MINQEGKIIVIGSAKIKHEILVDRFIEMWET